MSRKKLRARDKVVQKISKDGLVERNITAGEEKRVSMRNVGFQLRTEKPGQEGGGSATHSQVGNTHRGNKSHKKAAYRHYEASQEAAAQQPARSDSQYEQPGNAAQPDYEGNQQAQLKTSPDTPHRNPQTSRDEAGRPAKLQTRESDILRHDEPQGQGKLQTDSRPSSMQSQDTAQPKLQNDSRRPAAPNNAEAAPVGKDGKSGAVSPCTPPAPLVQPDKPGRLQFTREEADPSSRPGTQANSHRKLEKAERQANRAGERLKSAQEQLPTRRVIRSERVFDETAGRTKRRLHFEKEVIPQGQHLKGALPLRPVRAGMNAAIVYGHRKLFQAEHENVGTQAAHKGEMAAEAVTRTALRHHKTAPYRKVARLERAVAKKGMKLSYQRNLADNPQLKSNMLSRFMQKQKIRRQYAKAARDTRKAALVAKRGGSLVNRGGAAVINLIRRNPKAVIILAIFALLLMMMTSLVGLLANIGNSGLRGVITGSYLAENIDIDSAGNAFTEWETDLHFQIENAESDYPGFDEYIYELGEIGHDPFELLAYLTVMYNNYQFNEIEGDLRALFDEQYTLTFTETVETRYYTNEDGEEIPYDWHILTIKLDVKPLDELIAGRLGDEQRGRFNILMETKGGRQYAGSPFAFSWLSNITSHYGWRVDPFTGEKAFHTGIDIAVPVGTPIITAHDGIVTAAVWGTDGYGRYIKIEGKNAGSSGGGLSTLYAHCDTLLVSVGTEVKQGDVIATSGNTGSSTGPHLHYEVIFGGEYLNPLIFASLGE